MKVSIFIPTYNGSRFLAEALKCADWQTHQDKEIVVVDDCSTDDTVRIASKFDCRIVQNKERLGMVRNWNQCFDLCEGEWIKFLHQDDLLHPECIEKMLAHVGREKIVACGRNLKFEDGVSQEEQWRWREFVEESSLGRGRMISVLCFSPKEFAERMAKVPALNQIGEPSAVMIHRSALEAVGAFNEQMVQIVDWEYFARVALWQGIVYLNEDLATYRIHSGSQTKANMANRQMAVQWGDIAVLTRELAESPHYRKVRKAARPHDFKRQFEEMTTVHVLC